jgi:6,7-dimethyl-8-ribityllumazine synthase
MKEYEGQLKADDKRFAIVASRFNQLVVEKLVQGAAGQLQKLGASSNSISAFYVPGAFEIPAVARRLAHSNAFNAVICLGAVIRGETPHFDYVAGESAKGIAQIANASPVPVIYGVLTTETVAQAMDRAGSKSGNKGSDAAQAAVEMIHLFELIEKQLGE